MANRCVIVLAMPGEYVVILILIAILLLGR